MFVRNKVSVIQHTKREMEAPEIINVLRKNQLVDSNCRNQ